jgi:hypothetical protein
VHGDIEKAETPMGGLNKVMCRCSCRPRPIASRVSAWKGVRVSLIKILNRSPDFLWVINMGPNEH